MVNHINLKAPGNWINDPNGFIYYGGKYHLFFQYFPYGHYWGTMHWGHAVSEDLVDWQHLGIALFPSKPYDKNGIFSGSAIEKDGELWLYYTSVVYEAEKAENRHLPEGRILQSQAMIKSADGFYFDNDRDKKQIIPAIYDREIADPFECRDPKVWKQGDSYYMCLASTHLGEKGVLLVFKSDDAENWSLFSRLESKKLGYILECPDLFQVDGHYFLMCSPCGINADGNGPDNQAILLPVTFDAESGKLELAGEGRFLDYGLDIYAPQSNLDKDGKRVMISWLRMAGPKKGDSNPAACGKEWNGMMTIPRVLEVREGELYTRPHDNIRNYFLSDKCKCVSEGKVIKYFDDSNCRLITRLTEGEELDIGGYKIRLQEGKVVGDRSALVPENATIHKTSATPYVGPEADLEIYYDADIIEIYVNDGKYVLSHELF